MTGKRSSPATVETGRRTPRTWVFGLTLTFLVGTGTGITQATLTQAPFDFSVSPAHVREGHPVTLRIIPRGKAGHGGAGERYDIYIMRAFTQHAVFLTPSGGWSRQPIPYLQAVSVSQSTPMVREWPNAGPAGWIALCIVVVRTSTNPLIRLNWAFQPKLQYLMVRSSTSVADGPMAIVVFGFLGLVSAAASILVLFQTKAGG